MKSEKLLNSDLALIDDESVISGQILLAVNNQKGRSPTNNSNQKAGQPHN